MNFGLFIIGDEIISGKRQDKHFAKVVELLGARGLQLSWVQYIGDSRERLTAAYKASLAGPDVVFSCGGIGATPDDHTRQAVAAALGLPLELHPQARELITQRVMEQVARGEAKGDMSLPENQQRLKMGEFVQGARLIANPYNRIPGFNVGHHWFVPGFPVMAWPMIEAVLEENYSHLFHQRPQVEMSFLVAELAESTATPLMETIEQQYPELKVFSLPSMGEAGLRRHIELGVKGPPDQVKEAFPKLKAGALALGGVELSRPG